MIEYQIYGEARSYAKVPKGARILVVNGHEVVDVCEACGRPIFEGSPAELYADGAVHRRCPRVPGASENTS